jgi:hypothetical protein
LIFVYLLRESFQETTVLRISSTVILKCGILQSALLVLGVVGKTSCRYLLVYVNDQKKE